MRKEKSRRRADEQERGTDDRRGFPRISRRCVVDLRPVGSDDERFNTLIGQNGILQNISGGGACLDLQESFAAGTRLALKMHLPEIPSPIIALGRVVWCSPLGQGGYQTGVEFWWIGWEDPGAQESVRRFISQRLEED